jgi:hypothetical protein
LTYASVCVPPVSFFLVLWNINVLLVCVLQVYIGCVYAYEFFHTLLFLFGVWVHGVLFCSHGLSWNTNFFLVLGCVLGCILEFISGCYSMFSYLAFGHWCLDEGLHGTDVSESRCDQRSVGQSVLVLSPIWGSWPEVKYCLTVGVLLKSGAPSDKGSGLSFVIVFV